VGVGASCLKGIEKLGGVENSVDNSVDEMRRVCAHKIGKERQAPGKKILLAQKMLDSTGFLGEGLSYDRHKTVSDWKH
jgi:hypothetical protein